MLNTVLNILPLLAITLSFFLTIIVYKKFRYFFKILNSIPDPNTISRNTITAIGKNLNNVIDLPEQLTGIPYIVVISSSTCSQCYIEVEEFLEEKIDATAICLLLTNDNNDATTEFYSKFHNKINIINVDMGTLDKLNIDTTPLYLIIEPSGEIISQKLTIKSTLNMWNSLIPNPY